MIWYNSITQRWYNWNEVQQYLNWRAKMSDNNEISIPEIPDIMIPDLPIEDFEIPEEQDLGIVSTHGGSVEIALLGAGQGGSRIAEAFYKLGYAKTVVVNTAKHDLKYISIPEEQKLHIGGIAQGAGKNMDAGREAAESSDQEIYDLLQKVFGKTERIFVTVGVGGGSGAGSCQTLIGLAKRYLTYIGYEDAASRVGVIAALPTAGEAASPRVAGNSTNLVTALCDMADDAEISPLLIVDNDKIKKLYPGMTVKQFWPTVNGTIAGLFHTFNTITAQESGYTSFDPADYGSILSTPGCMILGVTSVKDWSTGTGISSALKSNLMKTLLAGGFDLTTAQAVGTVVIGGSDIFETATGLMDSIEYGFDTVANITGNAIVHRGIYEVGQGKLRVYTIMGGLTRPQKRIDELKKFQK
jgi:cell division GTPase FtsZ